MKKSYYKQAGTVSVICTIPIAFIIRGIIAVYFDTNINIRLSLIIFMLTYAWMFFNITRNIYTYEMWKTRREQPERLAEEKQTYKVSSLQQIFYPIKLRFTKK